MLDVTPSDYLTYDQTFSSETAITSFYATAYATLPIEDFNYMGGKFGVYPGNMRNTVAGWGAEIKGTAYGISASSNSWIPAYTAIRYANMLIQEMPKTTIYTDSELTELVAEAHFLRAFSYYFLVRNWGGVPIIKEPIEYTADNIDAMKYSRSRENDVWDFIMDDLEIAADGMGITKVYGRANKYVALAFRSRVALYAASIAKFGEGENREYCVGIDPLRADYFYAESMAAAKRVIEEGGYSLYNSYPGDEQVDKSYNFQMSFLDTRSSPEVILAKGFEYDGARYAHSYDCVSMPYQHVTYQGECNTPYLNSVEAFEFANGDPATVLVSETESETSSYISLDQLFAGRDPRMYATFVLPNTEFLGETISMQDGVVVDGSEVVGNDYNLYFDTVEELFVTTENEHTVRGTGRSGGGSITDGLTGFFMRKFIDINNQPNILLPGQSEVDWIVIRLAEVYLNYVEAAIESDTDLETALGYLNLVKERAGVAQFASTEDMTMERVVAERRSELFAEGFKYWDMVRRRSLLDEFPSLNSGSIRHMLEIYYNYASNTYQVHRDDSGSYGYQEERMYYQSLPTDEYAKHSWPNNPGY